MTNLNPLVSFFFSRFMNFHYIVFPHQNREDKDFQFPKDISFFSPLSKKKKDSFISLNLKFIQR